MRLNHIPIPGAVTKGTAGSATSAIAFPTGAELVLITFSVDAYYRYGTSASVQATTDDHKMPAGVVQFGTGKYTHVAVLRVGGADGEVSIQALTADGG